MNIPQMWRRVTTTRYARVLEAEVSRERANNERLRAENRALLNSILGIAGVPPLPASVEDLAAVEAAAGSAPRISVAPSKGAHVAVPMRKRSWQQINRMLEFESAQKDKPAIDTRTNGRG
jgi:hypothetical protein